MNWTSKWKTQYLANILPYQWQLLLFNLNIRDIIYIYLYILIIYINNIYILWIYLIYYNTRAISTTRTIFRLNTNQDQTYEIFNFIIKKLSFLNIKQNTNLLPRSFSAPDEWLVPNWDYIHRDMVIHDY